MNDLVVKNVGFCGAELLAVQEKATGKIYAGINSILRELGFDDGQVRYRRDKWMEDKVLSKGVRKFLHPSINGGNQETYCIEVKKLPLALAKLEITPKMEREMPDLVEKLEVYQDECADILAEAFLDKKKPAVPQTYLEALKELVVAEEEKERLQLELDRSKDWYSIKRVAALNGVPWKTFKWRRLKEIGERMGYGVKKIFDANYGEVNTYHRLIWEEAYPDFEI